MQSKHRNPWLALLLSLLIPGLGQIYNTQLIKGLIILAISQAVTWYLLSGEMLLQFSGLAVTALTLLTVELAAMIDAWIQARRIGETNLQAYNRSWVYGLVIAAELLISLPLDTSMPVEAYRIPSSSMEKTLLVGDRLIASHQTASPHWPGRGDVAIFAFPEDEKKDFVKRVMALPGDTIRIEDKRFYRNGTEIKTGHEHYTDDTIIQTNRDQLAEITLGPDQYFVLGDNRDHSYDSRFWGPVPAENIKARPLYIYWSRAFDRIGSAVE